VPSPLLETLSAFSNGRGGTILLGLGDSFTAVPIDAEALRDGHGGRPDESARAWRHRILRRAPDPTDPSGGAD